MRKKWEFRTSQTCLCLATGRTKTARCLRQLVCIGLCTKNGATRKWIDWQNTITSMIVVRSSEWVVSIHAMHDATNVLGTHLFDKANDTTNVHGMHLFASLCWLWWIDLRMIPQISMACISLLTVTPHAMKSRDSVFFTTYDKIVNCVPISFDAAWSQQKIDSRMRQYNASTRPQSEQDLVQTRSVGSVMNDVHS